MIRLHHPQTLGILQITEVTFIQLYTFSSKNNIIIDHHHFILTGTMHSTTRNMKPDIGITNKPKYVQKQPTTRLRHTSRPRPQNAMATQI